MRAWGRWAPALGIVALAFVATASAAPQSPSSGPRGERLGPSDSVLATLLAYGGIAYSERATNQVDSAYRWGVERRREPAMCVASGGFAMGAAANRKAFVFIFAFAVAGPQAAKVLGADSVTVLWNRDVCGDSLPSWHGHFIDTETRYRPSDCDLHMATKRPKVAFHLVQTAPSRAALYFLTPKLIEQYGSDLIQWCRSDTTDSTGSPTSMEPKDDGERRRSS